MADLGTTLSERKGPLPLWAWGIAILTGGAFLVYFMRGKSSGATSSDPQVVAAGGVVGNPTNSGGAPTITYIGVPVPGSTPTTPTTTPAPTPTPVGTTPPAPEVGYNPPSSTINTPSRWLRLPTQSGGMLAGFVPGNWVLNPVNGQPYTPSQIVDNLQSGGYYAYGGSPGAGVTPGERVQASDLQSGQPAAQLGAQATSGPYTAPLVRG